MVRITRGDCGERSVAAAASIVENAQLPNERQIGESEQHRSEAWACGSSVEVAVSARQHQAELRLRFRDAVARNEVENQPYTRYGDAQVGRAAKEGRRTLRRVEDCLQFEGKRRVGFGKRESAIAISESHTAASNSTPANDSGRGFIVEGKLNFHLRPLQWLCE